MLEVDISNIWGELSLPELLGLERAVFDAHMALTEDNHPLLALPGEREATEALLWAEEIRESSQVLVVLGNDGFARGSLELLGTEGDLTILFAQGSFSQRSREKLLRRLEGKSFSLCLCGEECLWDSLLLRELKWILERRWGTDEAASRIHRDPFGLITMAAGGLDVVKVQSGMEEARGEMDLRSYENPAWLYGAGRYLLGRKGRSAERLIYAEPNFAALADWWRQLFGTGAPVSVCTLLPGQVKLTDALDTMIRFEPAEHTRTIPETAGDPGGVNFLAGKTLGQVEREAWEALLEEDLDRDVPALGIDCGIPEERTLGQLYRFCRLSAALCEKLSERPETHWEQALRKRLGDPQS